MQSWKKGRSYCTGADCGAPSQDTGISTHKHMQEGLLWSGLVCPAIVQGTVYFPIKPSQCRTSLASNMSQCDNLINGKL